MQSKEERSSKRLSFNLSKDNNISDVISESNEIKPMRDLFYLLEEELNKEHRHWWDLTALEKYIEVKYVPRGLRILKHCSFKDDPALLQKWYEALNECSFNLIKILIEHRRQLYSQSSTNIEKIQTDLRVYQQNPDYNKILKEINERTDRFQENIVQNKNKKLQRDHEDYINNCVYTFNRKDNTLRNGSIHHNHLEARGVHSNRNNNNYYRQPQSFQNRSNLDHSTHYNTSNNRTPIFNPEQRIHKEGQYRQNWSSSNNRVQHNYPSSKGTHQSHFYQSQNHHQLPNREQTFNTNREPKFRHHNTKDSHNMSYQLAQTYQHKDAHVTSYQGNTWNYNSHHRPQGDYNKRLDRTDYSDTSHHYRQRTTNTPNTEFWNNHDNPQTPTTHIEQYEHNNRFSPLLMMGDGESPSTSHNPPPPFLGISPNTRMENLQARPAKRPHTTENEAGGAEALPPRKRNYPD
ncbi:GATA zinc finger domain-containing protein 14-like [Bombina bombina]|uniref:GATA zinc finger domain-containing protein 14-like n=1 Tax=Bombina bombina TaxID=8345 RepID=UPI00235A66C0|nr:GATA zinc finger domain-containing protein 14-like [Bombina bombina]